MMRGTEHITYKEKLRELALFSLMKRKVKYNLAASCNYLKGSYKGDGTELLEE